MDIAGLVVAVLAVAFAGWSALYARGANIRADQANKTAADALDLQRTIDVREREFRDVKWEGGWALADEDQGVFRLKNVGHTPACDVTVLVEAPDGEDGTRMWQFDTIEPGEHGDGPLGAQHREMLDILLFQHPQFEVHWSSPLGAKGTYTEPGLQMH